MPRAAAGCTSCKTEVHFKLCWVYIQLVRHTFKVESTLALATAQKQTHNSLHIQAHFDTLFLQTAEINDLLEIPFAGQKIYIAETRDFLKLYY